MSRKIPKIAHITPHVGGGVGAALLNLVSKNKTFEHYLLCLDKCGYNYEKFDIKKDDNLISNLDKLLEIIANCDIILLHYWNHPLLTFLLAKVKFDECRIIIWCHNSGLSEPHIIPTYLSKLSLKLVFSNSCSKLIPNFHELYNSHSDSNIKIIHSTCDLEEFIKIGISNRINLSKKKLLYIGTVSKSKMHQSAPQLFAKISKMGYEITVVGGPDHIELYNEVKRFGGNVSITGYSSNVLKFYKESDIFIYPLKKNHYGTGEQVMLEALASGLPIVAFDNSAESGIISDKQDGFLVSSCENFINSILKLDNDNFTYKRMSKNAVSKAINNFSENIMINKFDNLFNDVLLMNKVKVESNPIPSDCYDSIFKTYITSSFISKNILNNINNINLNLVDVIFTHIKEDIEKNNNLKLWLDPNKGTSFHYLKYFPKCKKLDLLSKQLLKLI